MSDADVVTTGSQDRLTRRPGWPAGTPLRIVVLVLAGAFAFGALDQYFGSRYWLFATAVSGMSAPWLLLPFLAGASQQQRHRAAWLGLAATWLALAADVLMIDSPMEGVRPAGQVLLATASSQWHWFLAGLISGPVYGLLGHRWRTSRSLLSAVLAALPVLAEPVIAGLGLKYSLSLSANLAEAAAGIALAGFFALAIARYRLRPAA